MLKIFVDSGSSIKETEKEHYGVDILPLRLTVGGKEYRDGIDLSMDEFYHKLIDENEFPHTALPSLGDAEEKVHAALAAGHEVLILCFASGLSGTYNVFYSLFEGEERVRVVDTKTAVGGIRILVEEANRHREEGLDSVVKRILALIPRIKVVAVPDTLTYLHRGGRLSRTAWAIGSVLQLKPLITLDHESGKPTVMGKARGKQRAFLAVAKSLADFRCDESYPIVPSYTYDAANLDTLLSVTDERYKAQMTAYDNLDPAVACHWGPSAYGYIFVMQE